jgi:hypothetical protein
MSKRILRGLYAIHDYGVLRSGNVQSVVTCPFCNVELAQAPQGIKAHFRHHRQRREITAEQEQQATRDTTPGLDAKLKSMGM